MAGNRTETVVDSNNGFDISCDNVNNQLIRFMLFDLDNEQTLKLEGGGDLTHEWTAYFEFVNID